MTVRRSRQQNLVVGNSSVRLLASNPDRRAIVITTDTNPLYISEFHPAAATNGLFMYGNTNVTILCCKDAGDWLTKELFAIAPAGNTNVSIIEVSSDPLGDVSNQ